MEGEMRNVTFAVVLMASAVAGAQGQNPGKAKEAAVAAKATIDKIDEAFNAHDAKTIGTMLDKSFFAEGPNVSAKYDLPEAFRTHLEQMTAQGGRITRDGMTLKTDDDGGAAWYIADYTFVPKVPPGALPVRRKMRESGVLVRRGKEWKVAMWHMSAVQPDPETPPAPTGQATPPPTKK
jgi:Domain of unknown function (DUF4440)